MTRSNRNHQIRTTMKKIAYLIALIGLTACTSDPEETVAPREPEIQGTPIVFNASLDDDETKAKFDENYTGTNFGKLNWEAGDRIGIYYRQSTGSRWATFTVPETGDNQEFAQFEAEAAGFVWNDGTESHAFYAYYPVPDDQKPNENNLVSEKTFYLSNNQNVMIKEELSDYTRQQLCVAKATVARTEGSAEVKLQFTPLLTYLRIGAYIDSTSEVFDNGAIEHVYLSHLTLSASGEGKIAGNYAIDLTKPGFIENSKGTTGTIDLNFDSKTGLELELTENAGRENAAYFYAVMLPTDLTGQELYISGLVTVAEKTGEGEAEQTVYKTWQISRKAKSGIDFQSGYGYDLYVKITPEEDVTSTFDVEGFVFRSDGLWYNYEEVWEKVSRFNELEALSEPRTEEQEAELAELKEYFAAMGNDLYFVKTNGEETTKEDLSGQLGSITKLLNCIYTAQGENAAPINVDMSDIKLASAARESGLSAFGSKTETNVILGSIILPNGLTKLNEGAFLNCTSMTDVTLPNELVNIAKNSFANTALTSIVIPNSVSSIGTSAFEGCTQLVYAKLPRNSEYTTLESRTFWGCTSLTSIIIPENVTSLNNNVFNGCTSLSSVTLLAAEPIALTSNQKAAFTGCANEGTLYVPAALVDSYKEKLTGTEGSYWGAVKNWEVKAYDPASATGE